MSDKKKKRRLFPFLLISILVIGVWIFYQEQFQAVEVVPVSMLRDDWWKDYNMCTGEVINSMSQEVGSFDGKKVDDLYVEIGQEVKTGDPLLAFDMEEEKRVSYQQRQQLLTDIGHDLKTPTTII